MRVRTVTPASRSGATHSLLIASSDRRPIAGHVDIAEAPIEDELEGTDSDDLGTASGGDVSTPVHRGSAARRSVHAHDYSVDACGRARGGDYGERSPSVMSEMVRHAADVKAGEVTGAASPNDDQVDALCLSWRRADCQERR